MCRQGRRTATIKADCVCDLRALTRAALLEALSQYPGDKEKVREMVEAHSQSRQATASALQRAGASALGERAFCMGISTKTGSP